MFSMLLVFSFSLTIFSIIALALLSREHGCIVLLVLPPYWLIVFQYSNIFSCVLHSVCCIVLETFYYCVDCGLVTSTLSEDGCSLLYSEE